jgi:hypothetical protein
MAGATRRKSSISADVFLPLRCSSSSTDEGGGARRRKALPDGDRQRPEPRQGTLAPPFASGTASLGGAYVDDLVFFILACRRCATSSASRSSTTPAATAWTSRDQALT